jgi:S-adenosylmethionine:tRNA ribosyltransferase-isomerase
MFDIKDYDYDLPRELVAQVPVDRRDHSRLLTVDRKTGFFLQRKFYQLPVILRPGDLLVVNNTRVVSARLFGHRETGGKVEILVLEHPDQFEENHNIRKCLLKSSKRPRPGNLIFFDSGINGRVNEILDNGLVRIEFSGHEGLDSLLEKKGVMPLPPYIKRKKGDKLSAIDKNRYQTVYSSKNGAVAAPTAGLHFTVNLIDELKKTGVLMTSITLHVGHGTFSPVRTRDIRQHELGAEYFHVSAETAQAINTTKKNGGRIIAVGTTVVRALETAVDSKGLVWPGEGKTGLLITPGFKFRAVEAIITNFHLPKSSLLFLVSAFAGIDIIKDAYQFAIKNAYRFYSYGDAMLIQSG